MNDSGKSLTRALMELAQELYFVEAEGYPNTPHWTVMEYLGELQTPESRVFWAFEDGRYSVEALPPAESVIQGFVMYRPALEEAWVMQLAVRRKGEGQGRALLEAFFDHIRRQGVFSQIGLEARADNAIACRLYASLGFQQLARREKYYRDGADAVVFRRTLRRS